MSIAAVLYWDSALSVVPEFGRVISQGLKLLGIDVKPLPIMDANLNVDQEVLARCTSDPDIVNADIVISVGGPPLSVRVGDNWLFEVIGSSYFLYSLDALIYDYSRVAGVAEFLEAAKQSRRLGVISPDRDACLVLNELAPAGSWPYSPFGGFFHPAMPCSRANRIAVVGTMGWELADITGESAFKDIVLAAPSAISRNPALEAFCDAIEQPGLLESIPNLAQRVMGLSAQEIYTHELTHYLARLDAFQKRRRRADVIKALANFPVDFFGVGWEAFTPDFKDCRYMGTVPHRQIGQVCLRYDAIVNFNPVWGYGLHDRVYTGIGSGCRVITPANRAAADLKLPDPDSLLVYHDAGHGVAEVADHALSLHATDWEAALQFRADNSWLARMDELICWLNSH